MREIASLNRRNFLSGVSRSRVVAGVDFKGADGILIFNQKILKGYKSKDCTMAVVDKKPNHRLALSEPTELI